ncbi:toll/interleukin-1 receptor domain-containing protein [uncultured Gimesia sp.]|uniref:toll/interleukin-1 receptor domain-containing protein n=1 Tax=uncultured Gimesia sp. TaxID=1678688 RepID=UPI0026089D90|nr:toll/interleukin-1 receptor domain-containing protein [uncultured Gimesia sp.]
MSDSVLVFVSHSSEDKKEYIEPIVQDLEECFINVWIDKKKIPPGKNLRKSIFRDVLDKADVALLFFTQNSLNSAWVDKEIKHVLRDESQKGNYDLNKIISIFDAEDTYDQISEKYPELTDDLLHLMPLDYDKIQLGQLISAVWSKHFSLQGGDIETKRQLLAKDQEIFQKDKELFDLKQKLETEQFEEEKDTTQNEFATIMEKVDLSFFLSNRVTLLAEQSVSINEIGVTDLVAVGLLVSIPSNNAILSEDGHDFFKWHVLNHSSDNSNS